MLKVLITGATGQVGSHLTLLLTGRAQLLAVDRSELDITDESAVNAIVTEFQPDFIINAAAHTAVDKAEEQVESSYAINELGPRYLAQASAQIGATILHISTDYVFEGNKQGCYSETDVTSPQGVYGLSKLAGEKAVIAENAKHIILRTAWVFGEQGNNFVKTMLRLGANREALSIVGDQFGGPTYAKDIAATLINIMMQLAENTAEVDENKYYGIYHYSGLPHVSWYEFARTIFAKAQEQKVLDSIPTLCSISTAEYPTPAKRPTNSTMNTSKITDTFSIQASNWTTALDNLQVYKDKG